MIPFLLLVALNSGPDLDLIEAPHEPAPACLSTFDCPPVLVAQVDEPEEVCIDGQCEGEQD